jgi:transposase
MDATTVAIDLAKNVFQVALANRGGRIIDRQRLTRRQFERFLETLTDDIEVIMESCGTSHYWGRRIQSRGVRVRLLPVQYVRPYVRRNKTDRADTDALLEAARCGEIRAVPVKTVEQQTLQAIHRIRAQWQTARVARIRLPESGITTASLITSEAVVRIGGQRRSERPSTSSAREPSAR